ncbi:MAG: hypothetical protein ACI4DP_00075 [Candidatus Ornithomonoglobus sp.]
MRERLTKQGQDFEHQFCSECECIFYGEPNGCNAPNGSCTSYCYFTEAAERLREYEDAEENGLLVRLPCKVGDTIWYVPPAECREGAGEYTVTGFCFDKSGCQIRTYNPKGVIIYFYLEYIGKTVFLTREEAEQVLGEKQP